MPESFDPYYSWLGIPPTEQPADYYRLLGLSRFESNAEAITNAAERQIRHVRTFQLGDNAGLSQTLLNELATARACLLDLASKAAYDDQLREQTAKQSPPPVAARVSATTSTVPRSTRRRASSRRVEVVKIVVGGIAGLAIGVLLLWYGFGIDVFGVMESLDKRTAKPLTQSNATAPPKAESRPMKSLDGSTRAKPIVPKSNSESDEQVAQPPAEQATMNDDSNTTLALPVWVTLRPTTLEASHGTNLSILYDSSVLASGVSAETNTYVLTATSPLTEITGFQIEAIPDSSLPESGPGRAGGNFVLTEFKVFVIGSDGEAAPVELRNASASFEQIHHRGNEDPYERYVATSAIDGDVKGKRWGWAIRPHVGKPHRMFVATSEPVSGSGTKLRITIDQQHGTQHTLGRFRLAVTSSPAPFNAYGDGRFVAPKDYFMGRDVTSVATVDLNGDGFLDLITSNADDHSVSVRLGNGDGTFANRNDFQASKGAFGLATGDVDHDGNVDLAVGSLTSNVSILLGSGDGTFGSPLEYVGSPEHRSVALNDLNNDRFLDLIYTNEATVSVRLGNDEGTFGEPTNYAVGDSPYFMTVTDINEDGAFDVITANHASLSVSVLTNSGNGDLQHRTDFPVGSKVRCVELGDVNGDGLLDLVTANDVGNNVGVLFGDGAGTFNNEVDYVVGALATSVSLADLNNELRSMEAQDVQA